MKTIYYWHTIEARIVKIYKYEKRNKKIATHRVGCFNERGYG